MKVRYLLFIVWFVLFSFFSVVSTNACELAITPAQSNVTQNEKLELIATRKQIHKKCNINMEDILIENTNCTIDQQTTWEKIGTIWSKTVTVSFPNVGEAYVKLVYDCEKHPGDIKPFTAINVIEPIKEDPPKPPDPVPSPPPEPTPPSDPPAPSPSAPENPSPPVPQTPTPTPPTQPTQPQTPSPPTPTLPKVQASQSSQPIINTKPSDSYILPSTINTTPDPYPEVPLTNLQPGKSKPTPKKTATSYFFDQSYFLLLMLLLLSMLLYLLRQFKLRYYINLLSLGILGFYLGGCICPIGLFERIGFLKAITPFGIFSLILLGILFLISLFFGRLFCGWICPQGALQEVLFHGSHKVVTPPIGKKIFAILPILIFTVSLLIPFFYKTTVFCKVDPFKIPFQQTGPFLLLFAFVLLAIGSVLFYRPFCRAICPLGFFLGVGSWLGEKLHLRIFSNQLTCTTCSSCSKTCKSEALSSKLKGELIIDPFHCIECGDCQITCPTKNKILQKAKN